MLLTESANVMCRLALLLSSINTRKTTPHYFTSRSCARAIQNIDKLTIYIKHNSAALNSVPSNFPYSNEERKTTHSPWSPSHHRYSRKERREKIESAPCARRAARNYTPRAGFYRAAIAYDKLMSTISEPRGSA